MKWITRSRKREIVESLGLAQKNEQVVEFLKRGGDGSTLASSTSRRNAMNNVPRYLPILVLAIGSFAFPGATTVEPAGPGGQTDAAYNQCSMLGFGMEKVFVWTGQASFVNSKTGGIEDASSSGRGTNHALYDERYEARAVAKICGVTCGPLGVLRGNIRSADFFYERKDQRSVRHAYDECVDGSRPSPGSWSEMDEFVEGVEDPASQPSVAGTLAVSPDGSYDLMLTVRPMNYYLVGQGKDESYSACSGRTKKITSITAPDVVSGVSGTFENSVIHVTSPVAPVAFLVVDSGQVVERYIQGSDDIVQEETFASGRAKASFSDPGDSMYIDRLTSNWSLFGATPCERVEWRLQMDLAFLIAYSAPGPRIEARADNFTVHGYDRLVTILANQILDNTWGPRPGDSPSDDHSTDMSVGADCKIHGKDERKKAAEESCEPEVVFDSLLKHEETHVRQCGAYPEHFRWDPSEPVPPDALAEDEIEAYCVGSRILLDWLKQNCPRDYSSFEKIFADNCP
jgi:hypothetical protein